MMAALPRPRLPKNRSLWLGYATGAVVLALLLGATLLSRVQVGDKTIEAEFIQAAGLRKGDTVDVAGIQVGTVQSERIEDDHIIAVLRVGKDVRLGPDARASIKMTTILGKMHVELVPGNRKGLPGNRIRVAGTTVPYNLAKVVNDPHYTSSFERIERLDPQKLRQTLDVMSRQMGSSPQLTVDALDSIGTLAKVVNDRRDEVDSLLKNMDTVSRLVADNQNNVLLLLTRGQAIGDAVGKRQELIRRLLDNVAALSRQLQAMGIENKGQLGPFIHNLNTMSEGLEKNRDNLDRLLQIMPVGVRQFNNVVGNGPYGDVYVPWGLFPDNWVCLVQAVRGCR